MAIESIDLIVPTAARDLPGVCELVGPCGNIFTVKVFAWHFGNDPEPFTVDIVDLQSGVTIESAPDKVWNLLVPDTLADPVTQAEIVLALHDRGVDF